MAPSIEFDQFLASNNKRPSYHRETSAMLCQLKCHQLLYKQGVALTGCNTTGPPCSVTMELYLDRRRHDVIAWRQPPADPPRSVLQTTTSNNANRSRVSLTRAFSYCRFLLAICIVLYTHRCNRLSTAQRACHVPCHINLTLKWSARVINKLRRRPTFWWHRVFFRQRTVVDADHFGGWIQIFGGKASEPETSQSVEKPPPAFGAPLGGWSYRNFVKFVCFKTYGHKFSATVLRCFRDPIFSYSVQHRLVTDRQADRQTQGHRRYCVSKASRG